VQAWRIWVRDVPASQHPPQGWQGPYVLAPRALGADRLQGRAADGGALGELDAQGRARTRAPAQALVGSVTQPDLFTHEAAEDAVVPVRLDRVRLESGRRFGDMRLGGTRYGRGDRRDDGGPLWARAADLGDGSWHD
jgi:hypothetical protein